MSDSRWQQIKAAVARLVSTPSEPEHHRFMVRCPVCGYRTLERDMLTAPAYSICPICFWEDELWPGEESNPDAGGGPNRVLLGEARRNYEKFGAVEQRLTRHVRRPTASEIVAVKEHS
jgi:hypothetical protein